MGNKITFKDKIKVQELGLPDVNVLRDVDVNEIKEVVNGIEDRVTNIETNNTTPISVSAIWDSGLKFNVRADSFPVSGEYFSATAADVTLDTADPTNPRFDLIVANKPIAPNTVGTVGFVKGTPSVNPSEPDYDPDLQYVIKLVLIEAGATLPKDQSGKEVNRELVFDEGVGEPTEWTVSLDSNLAISTNDFYSGANSIEATNPTSVDKITLTNATTLNTDNLDVISFRLKLKQPIGTSYIFLEFFNSGVKVGNSFPFNKKSSVLDSSNLNWQQIVIDQSQLNLPSSAYDQIKIFIYKSSYSGYFIDLVQVHTGSGGSPQSQPQIQSDWNQTDESAVDFIKNKPSTGIGDMEKSTYDPTGVEGDAFSMDNMSNMSGSKATPIDADNFTLWDSVSSVFKKVTFANLKAVLNTVYQTVLISGINIKTINGESVLGSGDLAVGGGADSVGVNELKPELKSRIVNNSVSGTFSLDHSLANDWKLTLTGNTILQDINLVSGLTNTEFTLKITGNFALTIPSYWTIIGDNYDGNIENFYAVQIHKGDSPEEVTAFLTNL